jgi:hypothetical protein
MRPNPVASADIWVMDLTRGTESRLSPCRQRTIVLCELPTAKIWFLNRLVGELKGCTGCAPTARAKPHRLTEGKPRQVPFSSLPDGKRLAYSETSTSPIRSEHWTAPVEGDLDHPRLGKSEPLLRTPFSEGMRLARWG